MLNHSNVRRGLKDHMEVSGTPVLTLNQDGGMRCTEQKRGGESAQINTSMGSLCFRLALTGKMPSCSWRSSTSFTSVDMLLLLGVCQAPVSIPRPGRQGKTLLANWRHSGQVNSPLSTENPWRTWSFWKQQIWHCSFIGSWMRFNRLLILKNRWNGIRLICYNLEKKYFDY